MDTRIAVVGLCCGALAACRPAVPVGAPEPRAALAPRVVPEPVSRVSADGPPFTLTSSTRIVVDGSNTEAAQIAEQLAAVLRPATGFPIPIDTGTASTPSMIALRLTSDDELGVEGYRLVVSTDSVRLTAQAPAGLFYAAQTLRQLLPPQIESDMALAQIPWQVPALAIFDRPRFAWRGAMLDVARHFMTVREIKDYIDLLALYKLNVLHLHLTDDQGWRIEIKSRPKLAALGSVTQVGGGPGGYYTQEEYTDLVRYAHERYITIVPEVDMPGHTNAALVAHPELSCSRRPPAPYTGTEVGWSTFCADKEETYALVEDIVREIAALTPGRYFHMGGDENPILSQEQYTTFVERTQEIIARHGKQMVGWEEIAQARLRSTTLAQAWHSDTTAVAALRHGAKLILSPSRRVYLDMKYNASTELGLDWAALIEVRDAYEWDPASFMQGVTESDIVGVEAPMWTETLRNITAVQYMAMPRLPAVAELAWTPQRSRDWDSFRTRIATHAPRWRILGVNYYRSPQVPW